MTALAIGFQSGFIPVHQSAKDHAGILDPHFLNNAPAIVGLESGAPPAVLFAESSPIPVATLQPLPLLSAMVPLINLF